MRHSDQSLNVGEAVVRIDYPDSTTGEIGERLYDDYVLVMWVDAPTPTVHNTRDLSQVGAGTSIPLRRSRPLSSSRWHPQAGKR